LLLPGHFDCCYRPIVAWLSENMPDVKFSLRDGYQPRWRAKGYDELAAPLRPEQALLARRLASQQDLRIIE
jgi:putative pyruvate formate lyase activating enzyme